MIIHLPAHLSVERAEVIKADLRQPYKNSDKIFGGKACSMTSVGQFYWNWLAGRGGTYNRSQPSGKPVISMPESLKQLAIELVAEYCPTENYEPQVALLNVYTGVQKLNMHVDRDELVNSPIISISFNADGIFEYIKNGRAETCLFSAVLTDICATVTVVIQTAVKRG